MYLKQLPSGSWRWIVQHRGEKRTGTAGTRERAQQAGAEALLDMGSAPVAGVVTVGELLRGHVDGQGYSARTVEDFNSLLRRLPADIKAWRVRDVEPIVVQHWYRQLERAGWSPHRLLRLHTLLSSAWNRARRYEWARRNVLHDVDRPRVKAADVRPPSADEVRLVLDRVGPALRLYLRMAALTGARRGELVGLQWGDVALDSGQVVFRRSVAHPAGAAGPVVTDGKTGRKGHRVVSVDEPTIEALKAHRREQVELALAHGLPAPVWMFSHDAGCTPWRGDYVTHQFVKARDAAGVTGVRLHDLRHFMATSWLADGVPVSVVAHRLGHANPNTTYRVYSHYVQAADKDAASRLGAVL